MKKLKITLLILWIASTKLVAQEDPLFTQYLINPLSINPAYAGANDMLQATVLSRVQWIGVADNFGAPATNLLSVSMPISKYGLSFGLNAMQDNYAFNKVTELDGIITYRIYHGKEKISFGITTGFINRGINYDKLNVFHEGDSAIANPESGFKPTFGFGYYYKTNKKYLGISIPRLTDASITQDEGEAFKRQVYLTAGYLIDHPRIRFLRIRPSVLVKYVENGRLTVDLSGTAIFNDMMFIGVSVRNYNSVNLFAQFQVNGTFRLGYSVDLATNDILTNSYGTHEFSVLVGIPLLQNHRLQTVYF